jgi:hypothetical protein
MSLGWGEVSEAAPPQFFTRIFGIFNRQDAKSAKEEKRNFPPEGVDRACRLRYIGIVRKCAGI